MVWGVEGGEEGSLDLAPGRELPLSLVSALSFLSVSASASVAAAEVCSALLLSRPAVLLGLFLGEQGPEAGGRGGPGTPERASTQREG